MRKQLTYLDDMRSQLIRERIYEVIGNWLLVVAGALLITICVIANY